MYKKSPPSGTRQYHSQYEISLAQSDFGLALEVAVVEPEVAPTGERATWSLGKGSVSSNSEG